MPRFHTYYLGRVIKIGNLDSEKIYNAIKSPQAFYWYGSGWSFFDAEENERGGVPFIAGRLSKFDPKAEQEVALNTCPVRSSIQHDYYTHSPQSKARPRACMRRLNISLKYKICPTQHEYFAF